MGVEEVEAFIKSNSIDAEVKVLEPESTRTSALAAEALKCTVAEIAKSIVFFYTKKSEMLPVVVVLSGDKMVDEKKLTIFLGAEDIERMNAEEVKRETGYAIGGVPPFPHKKNVRILIDKSLFRFRRVWGAAGAPNAVMHISPEILANKLHIEITDVSK
ncbi:MAG: YbaK/EbsC family protein [Candidatus Micrarchaeia archaeon]